MNNKEFGDVYSSINLKNWTYHLSFDVFCCGSVVVNFVHILQVYITGTNTNAWLPQYQWSSRWRLWINVACEYTIWFICAWWRHQMETFSALPALCAGNSPVAGEFPALREMTRSSDVSFDLRLNRPLSKQSWGWWFQTPSRSLWRHCNGSAKNKTMCIVYGIHCTVHPTSKLRTTCLNCLICNEWVGPASLCLCLFVCVFLFLPVTSAIMRLQCE